jgi:hypothetical protein
MAGSWRLVLGVVVAALSASPAEAFNGRLGWWRTPPTVSYYYVAPLYYYCPPLGPTVIPVPDASSGWARPTAAPPSQTAEPPLQRKAAGDPRMPVITASHALGTFTPGKSPTPDRCRVGFWNLTGRDVTVQVEGKSVVVLRDKAVTLDLDRQFIWQIAGQTQHIERVPEGQPTYEVIMRE